MINIDFHGLWRFSSQQMIWVEKKPIKARFSKGTKSGQYEIKANKIRSESRCPEKSKADAQKNKSVQQKPFFNLMPDLYVWFF